MGTSTARGVSMIVTRFPLDFVLLTRSRFVMKLVFQEQQIGRQTGVD
jgi:hypothetical protein